MTCKVWLHSSPEGISRSTTYDMLFSSFYLPVILIVFQNYGSIIGEELQYCPFYNNRGTSPQPFLKNCTWYADNACCQQIEIDYAFASVKPPQGASLECQRQLNYLMCYICDPLQYKFYRKEYLTVCSEFCDNLYNACKDATLKGSVIGQLYTNGEEFCKSRRFVVRKRDEQGCFYYSPNSLTSIGSQARCQYGLTLLMILLSTVKSIWY
mgnify:CR=1 FL=1